MDTKFVKVKFDINCSTVDSIYRIFVNNELFTERTWIWDNTYLEEMLQIQAEPGQYHICIESVLNKEGNFTISNREVTHGPARWIDADTLEIA